MKIHNIWVGAGFLVSTLSGCGADEVPPITMNKPVLASGSGAPTMSGTAGMTPPPVSAPTAGMRATNTAGSAPPTAGAPTAGSISAGKSGAGGAAPVAGMSAGTTGSPGKPGECCMGGDCLCHGDLPTEPTSSPGKYKTDKLDISAGCIFYPTDAEPPFAAVAISDGAGGEGGCTGAQTSGWGPLYASWGIVAMIIHTTGGDQPNQRGTKLTAGIAAFKAENMKMGSPLMGKLSGRYGTSGFSMGGGGTTFAAAADSTLKTNVGIMAWGPSSGVIKVPSLFIFGSSDTLANTMGMSSYTRIADPTPKMTVTVNSGHAGQPSSGAGGSGKAGLAFQKVYLEGDERWKPILAMVKATDTNIK